MNAIEMTRAGRRETVRQWASEMLSGLPEQTLSQTIGVHRIGAEFGESMVCRVCLEKMRDYPHMIYLLDDPENSTGLVGKWLDFPGMPELAT